MPRYHYPSITPSDLHVLRTPPAFVLSQDQTRHPVYSLWLSFCCDLSVSPLQCLAYAIALLHPAYAVLLLLTLQLFRFAGGLAAHCIDVKASDTKMIISYRRVRVKPYQYRWRKCPPAAGRYSQLDWARYPISGQACRLNEIE
jgi:hypothetical protein